MSVHNGHAFLIAAQDKWPGPIF